MTKEITVEQLESFLRYLKFLIGCVLLLVVPLIIYLLYLDRQFHEMQSSMRYRPPQEADSVDHSIASDLFHLDKNPVSGQLVYVPAYSHIYHDDGDPYLLTITLSVRNTSLKNEIVVKSVRYFDTKGQLVKSYLKKPVRVPTLGTTEVLVERDDSSGGSGANFLVEWVSETPVTEPIIEAIMIDTEGQQGISFARRGSVISELIPETLEGESAE